MKTIKAKIEKDTVLTDTTDVELKELPAYKNWDKLRQLGWVSVHLIGEEKYDGLIWHYPENDLDKLELEIATYDWFYEMSDDYRVYSSGCAKDDSIRELANKVGKKKYSALWNSYVQKASHNYADPEEFISRYSGRFG